MESPTRKTKTKAKQPPGMSMKTYLSEVKRSNPCPDSEL